MPPLMQPSQPLHQPLDLLNPPPTPLTRTNLLLLTQIQKSLHQLAIHKAKRLLRLADLVLERAVRREGHVAWCGYEGPEAALQIH